MKNAASTAAGKLPTLGPGGFRFVTNSLTGETADGRRRFRAVASSTVTDLAGNTISPRALMQMRDDFRSGLPIFMDHDYTNVVDKVFGMTDAAEIVETGEKDERSNKPVYDLIVGGMVNEPNPRAIQLHDSIAGGYVKFGASIGAIVRDHKRDKETGGMLIDGITAKEASIVGIPKNQRSWVYKASAAVADLPDDEHLSDDEDDEETPVVANTANGAQVITLGITTTDPTTTTTNNITGSSTVYPLAEPTTLGEKLLQATYVEPTTEPGSTDEVDEDASDTPGGQEAEAATPETAPEADGSEADPAIEQKASDDTEAEGVVALVQHVERLIHMIGERDERIATLENQVRDFEVKQGQLSQAQDDAVEMMRQVMELPLQRKAVGFVQNHVERFSDVYDPRVVAYLERTTKEIEA